MECYYHPSRESTDNCAICGKSICKECGLEIAGRIYCKECLEKIVGIGLSNKSEEVKEEPAKPEVQEPIVPERQEPAEDIVERSTLISHEAEEIPHSTHKVPDDSPYRLDGNIQYESGLESRYETSYPEPEEVAPQPQQEVYEPQERITPQKPVRDVREEYVPQEPVQQARNEYDYVPNREPVAPSQDYIYPDHSYEPQQTGARRELESKYERYLDDLHFDEKEVPLNEQLARDEAKYGSLTRNEYQPRNSHEQQTARDDEIDRRVREELLRREGERRTSRHEMLRDIDREEKEPYSAVDIILTIILIIVIILVVIYILYVVKLNATYPTFIDAMLGLRHPGQFLNALL